MARTTTPGGTPPVVRLRELVDLLASGSAPETIGVLAGSPVVVVELDDTEVPHTPPPAWRTLPCVLVGVSPGGTRRRGGEAPGVDTGRAPGHAWVDLVVPDVEPLPAVDIGRIADTVARHPHASVALALVLRADLAATAPAAGLVLESATYSTLQAGPEFASWLAARRDAHPGRDPAATAPPTVAVTRADDVVEITLQRGERHNAFSRQLRDELLDALRAAQADPSVAVVLRGDGPSFCSGGDLDEFGSFGDPSSAHLVRLTASPATALLALGDRCTVHLHGHCLGAGIELAAFAHRVVAHPDTRLGLPEVALGLVPGAGGTVSLPRRIGRHRTALLALAGGTIDVSTALAWGLVDAIGEP
jgi:hypothetical protein